MLYIILTMDLKDRSLERERRTQEESFELQIFEGWVRLLLKADLIFNAEQKALS